MSATSGSQISPNVISVKITSQSLPPISLMRPNRCQHIDCRKKLHLTDYACKCSGYYCSSHKFSSDHKCLYDYAAMGRQQLSSCMNIVIGKKLEKL